ncbi:MAG: serine/threonine-protein kinase [Planctomycetota bacterium]
MLDNSRTDSLSFGHLAVKYGFITLEQLKECIELQEQYKKAGIESQKLGEILAAKGYMTKAQVVDLFRHQSSAGKHTRIENYEIVAKVGKGAMGTVYKAKQLSLNRIVALKILPPRLAADKEYISRFLTEARVAAKLNHENIIYVIDVGESGGIYYFAMEYVEGKTVKEILEEQGSLTEKASAEIAIQITRALDHAAGFGIIHRDIKPANIIITNEGRIAKLCDFGLAKEMEFRSAASTQGTMAGTPYYVSPEQIRGEEVDVRSDIYSLGGTIYHMATGSVPFPGKSAPIVMVKHLQENMVPPHQLNANISQGLESVILKCMSKKRQARFQTPKELLHALEQLLLKPVVVAKPAKKAFTPPKFRKKTIRPLIRRRRRLKR